MRAMLTAFEIVEGLRGTNAAARFFGVKPPSVTEWVKNGAIPEDKLIRKAALLEEHVAGFTRRDQFPSICEEIWPELAPQPVPHGQPPHQCASAPAPHAGAVAGQGARVAD